MNSVFDDPIKQQQNPEVQRILAQLIAPLIQQRHKKRMSQKRLARRCGTSQNRIGVIETGSDLQLTTFIRMCMALDREPAVNLKYWRDPLLAPITPDQKEMMEKGEIDENLKEVELSDYMVRKLKREGVII